MDLNHISVGENPPYDFNTIIEIPMKGEPVKYEVCKKSGAMFVDRFLHTAMYYPGNYGFIPHTLAEDGDPMDVLVVGNVPVSAGSVMRSRPIGIMYMEDEAGTDEKILAVPHRKLHPFWNEVETFQDLPEILVRQITHFFEHYKDLEAEKWVKIKGWGGPDEAAERIEAAVRRARAG